MILEKSISLELSSTLLHKHFPQDSSKLVLEDVKSYSDEIQSYGLFFYLAASSQDPEFHFMVTAVKATFDIHTPSESFLVCGCKIQHSTSSH